MKKVKPQYRKSWDEPYMQNASGINYWMRSAFWFWVVTGFAIFVVLLVIASGIIWLIDKL